ncbi:MAG: 4Fe-4S dicluster domain-containing protein [Minisyncoccales bacterium]
MPKVTVDKDKCTGCEACVSTCPVEVFEMKDGKAEPIKESECIACHACEGACPVEAIKVED